MAGIELNVSLFAKFNNELKKFSAISDEVKNKYESVKSGFVKVNEGLSSFSTTNLGNLENFNNEFKEFANSAKTLNDVKFDNFKNLKDNIEFLRGISGIKLPDITELMDKVGENFENELAKKVEKINVDEKIESVLQKSMNTIFSSFGEADTIVIESLKKSMKNISDALNEGFDKIFKDNKTSIQEKIRDFFSSVFIDSFTFSSTNVAKQALNKIDNISDEIKRGIENKKSSQAQIEQKLVDSSSVPANFYRDLQDTFNKIEDEIKRFQLNINNVLVEIRRSFKDFYFDLTKPVTLNFDNIDLSGLKNSINEALSNIELNESVLDNLFSKFNNLKTKNKIDLSDLFEFKAPEGNIDFTDFMDKFVENIRNKFYSSTDKLKRTGGTFSNNIYDLFKLEYSTVSEKINSNLQEFFNKFVEDFRSKIYSASAKIKTSGETFNKNIVDVFNNPDTAKLIINADFVFDDGRYIAKLKESFDAVIRGVKEAYKAFEVDLQDYFTKIQNFYDQFSDLRVAPVDTKVRKLVSTVAAFRAFIEIDENVDTQRVTTKITIFKNFVNQVTDFLFTELDQKLVQLSNVDDIIKRSNKAAHSIHMVVNSFQRIAEVMTFYDKDTKQLSVIENKKFPQGFEEYYSSVINFFKISFSDDIIGVLNKFDIDETKINKASKFILSFGELISVFQKLSSDKIVNTATIQKTLDGISGFFIVNPSKGGGVIELFNALQQLVIPKSIDITVKTISGIIRSFSSLSNDKVFDDINITNNVEKLTKLFDKTNTKGNINKLFESIINIDYEEKVSKVFDSLNNFISIFKRLSKIDFNKNIDFKNSIDELAKFVIEFQSYQKNMQLIFGRGRRFFKIVDFNNDFIQNFSNNIKNVISLLNDIANIDVSFDQEKLVKKMALLRRQLFGTKVNKFLFFLPNAFKSGLFSQILRLANLKISKSTNLNYIADGINDIIEQLKKLSNINVDFDQKKLVKNLGFVRRMVFGIPILPIGGLKRLVTRLGEFSVAKSMNFSYISEAFKDLLNGFKQISSFKSGINETALIESLGLIRRLVFGIGILPIGGLKRIITRLSKLSTVKELKFRDFTNGFFDLFQGLKTLSGFDAKLDKGQLVKSLGMIRRALFGLPLGMFGGISNMIKRLAKIDFAVLGKFKEFSNGMKNIVDGMRMLNNIGGAGSKADIVASLDYMKRLFFGIFGLPFTGLQSVINRLSKINDKGLDKFQKLSRALFNASKSFTELNKVDLDGTQVKKFIAIMNNIFDGLNKPARKDKRFKNLGKDIGKDIEKGAKEALEIKSPSGVFKKIAGFSVKGFQIGIAPLKKLIKDSIDPKSILSTLSKLVNQFKHYGGLMSKAFSGSFFNIINQIKQKLVITFDDVFNTIQNIGQQAFGNAIDFEAGFTRVIKTIDIADEKIPELENMLRDLATAGTLSGLENAQQSIFDIAEAAGSLGIPVENMREFVTTAGQMAIATNLAAGDAATFFGQFGAITTSTAYEQIGATMVALGNDFAATESQISEFALRLAGAGNSAGLSEAEILSLSAALASVGFEAEAGGTAMSTIINKLVEASAKGGSELKAFSDTAGIEAKEFAKLWNDNPTAALDKFIAGLGKLDAAQQLSVIDQLGLDGIRTSDVLRRLGNAGDILTEAITTGNEAWDKNIALLEEAEKANNTTKASIERLKNNWKDLTVTIGKAFSPVIKQFADSMIYVVDILQNYFGGTSVQTSLTNTMQLVADILKNVVDFGVSVANFVGQIINNNPIIQSIMSTISGIVTAIKDSLAIATQALNDFTGFGKPTSDEQEKLKTYDELIAKKKMLEEQSFFEGSALPPLVQEYTIKAGDSMWQIAHDNGIPLEALYAANNMEGGDIILPNQKINIPMDLSAVSTAEDGTTLQSTVQTEIDAIQKQIDDLGLDNPEGIREAINSLALADYSHEFDLLKINLGEGLKGALSIFSLFAMPFPIGIGVSVVSLLTTAITNDIGGLRTSLEKSGFIGNAIIQFSDSLQQVFDGVANVLSGKGLMVDSGTVNNSWDVMDELGNIIMPEQELGAFADNPIVKFVNSLYNSISSILESFGTIDTSKLQFLFDTITGFVNDKMNFLLGNIGWTIENIFAPAIKTLVDKFKELLDKVPPEKLEKAVLVIGTVIGLFSLPVILPVVVAIAAISAAISGFGYALEPLTLAASDVFDFFDSLLHGDWDGAKTAFVSFLSNITLAVGNFFLGIADFTFSIMDSLLGIEPGTTKENTVNMINGWFDDIKYGAKLLSDFIYRTFSGMWIQVELGAIQVQKGFAKVTGQWEWVGELEARETTLANARDVGVLLSDKVKEGFSEEGGLDTIIGTNKWGNEYSLRDLIKFDPEMLKNLPAESFDEFIRISNELLASGDLKNQIDAFELLDAMGIGLLPSQIQEYVGDLDGFDIATLFMTFDAETISKYVTPEQLSKFFTPLGAEITKLVTSTDFTTMSIEDKQKFFANLMDDIARVGAIDMDSASALWETLYSIVGANFSPEEAALILSQFTFKPEDVQKEKDKLATAGNNILSGLFNGFTQLVSGEKPEDVLKNVGQTMIDEFNNIFQIHSPSAVMEEKGLNIVTGLVNGIINAKQSLTTEIDLLIADVNRISLAFFGIILDLTLFNISFFNAVNVFRVNKNIFKTELQDLIDKIDSVTAALGRMQVGASVSVPTVGEEGTSGGRYYGGNVERGKIYEILENNLPFEIYETNNKKFFIPNSNGNIQSPASSDINRSVGVSGNTYNTYNEAPVSIVVNGGNKSPEAIADIVYKKLENEKKQARRKLLLSGTSGV